MNTNKLKLFCDCHWPRCSSSPSVNVPAIRQGCIEGDSRLCAMDLWDLRRGSRCQICLGFVSLILYPQGWLFMMVDWLWGVIKLLDWEHWHISQNDISDGHGQTGESNVWICKGCHQLSSRIRESHCYRHAACSAISNCGHMWTYSVPTYTFR